MKLSIVIPVYNTELFIRKCLNSIVDQNISPNNLEVIVVNDGTKDNSISIINEFCSLYSNFKLINQSNSGLGAARNAGLKRATGDYVWFLDSDDFISDNSVKKILHEVNSYKPDILTLDFTCTDKNGVAIDWIEFKFFPRGGIGISGPDFFKKNYKWSYSCMYVMKISLLISNDLYFQPRINMQDAELIPQVLFHAKTVNISNISAYIYVKREESFINSVSPSVRERYFESVLEVHSRLTLFLKSLSDSDFIMKDALIKKINSVEEILFLSYVYENFGFDSTRKRLIKLKIQKVYPFEYNFDNKGMNKYYRKALLLGVNYSPIFFVGFFNWFRLHYNAFFK